LIDDLTIGFVGLSHLGLNSAAATATKGCKLVCYDSDRILIQSLVENNIPTNEPDLAETIEKYRSNISFVSDHHQLEICDLIYVSMDVPTDQNNRSDLTPIRDLIQTINSFTSKTTPLIVHSQVPPGFTRSIKCSQRPIFYQVETLIFGQALKRALEPERIVIGCSDLTYKLDDNLQRLLESYNCPLIRMGYESAELLKISINLYLIATLSVTNMMAELCEKLDADWDEIVPALQLDRRIGKYAYLKPGLGFSGGNLERDLATTAMMASNLDCNSALVDSWISDNVYRKKWVIDKLQEHDLISDKRSTLAILGLAYKPNTSSIKNSVAIDLLTKLIDLDRQHKINVFDPVVTSHDIPDYNVTFMDSALQTCHDADALLLMTPWEEFQSLVPSDLANIMKGTIVIDPYRILNPVDCKKAGLNYFTLGKNCQLT